VGAGVLAVGRRERGERLAAGPSGRCRPKRRRELTGAPRPEAAAEILEPAPRSSAAGGGRRAAGGGQRAA
jgi:hypothetical protein